VERDEPLTSAECEDALVLDDATRRQLRFSLFLQGMAALMLLGTFIVRVTQFGWDVIAVVVLAGLLLVGAAGAFTITRLRAG
jgi:predicted nucleic acid-binding Zn ribbon protein